MEEQKNNLEDSVNQDNNQDMARKKEETANHAADCQDDKMTGSPSQSDDNPSEAINQGESPSFDWHDKYLRLSAEFDNYRKRTLKEKMDLTSTGGEDVIKSLLPVMDDFDRALAAMSSTADANTFGKGVKLIHTKLCDTLKKHGVCEIEAIGKDMDTDLFEAIARIPVEKKQRGKVVDVVQKGYKLKDKVIRYAKVVVGE